MDFKKLKLATGILGLVGVLLAAACYILSLVIANKGDGGEEMLAVVLVFITFGIPLGIAGLVELVISIIYIAAKFKTRAFYIVGVVLSVLDLVICFILIYFAILTTQASGKMVVSVINAFCSLLVVATIVLKILCAVKFKMNEE